MHELVMAIFAGGNRAFTPKALPYAWAVLGIPGGASEILSKRHEVWTWRHSCDPDRIDC